MKRFVNAIAAAAVIGFMGMLTNGSVAHAAELPKDANTTCPVMTKEDVDPDMFVDYKGQRIYMCCSKCKRHFKQNPEKYLSRLPKADDAKTTKTQKAPSK